MGWKAIEQRSDVLAATLQTDLYETRAKDRGIIPMREVDGYNEGSSRKGDKWVIWSLF